MNSNLLSKAVRYALVAGAATAMAAPAVYAQDTAAQSSSDQNQNTAQLGKIEVTGTRIKRTDVETAQPVVIVTQQQLKATGLTSVGDILQTLSSTGSALNTQFNNGGNGSTFIDLRNLGSNRVLVLVNGRRWVSGLGGAVDLNTIPVSVIDHVEILQDGASAIYGSDAISGVINIITVKNYNGAEANAYIGIAKGDGNSDGKQKEFDFTIGSSGDRAGAVMNISYVNVDPIWAGSRNISKEPIVGLGHQHGKYDFKWPDGTSSSYAAGVVTPWYTGSAGTPAGLLLTILAAPADCAYNNSAAPYGTCTMTLKDGVAGTAGVHTVPGDFKQYTPADSFNYAPQNYLVTPSERTGVYVQGHYDIADNLTFTTEMIYNRRVSAQALAASPLYLGNAGSSQANGQNIGVSGDNPYNPYPGRNMVPYYPGSAAGQNWCAQYGSGVTAANPCGVNPVWYYLGGRRPLEAGLRVFNQDVQTYQFNSGFNGYFNMLGSEWDWDVNYLYSTNNRVDLTSGLFNTDRLQKALSHQCVAGSLPGCVPFDFFGGASYDQATGAVKKGTITPDMTAYTTYEAHDLFSANMRDYTANITGDLGDWWGAGPVSTALGAEYLSFDGFSHPDATTSSGNTSGNVTQPTDGKETTRAEYIEFNIPLVTDAAFAKSLNLDIANRWSHFKWRGGTPGTTGSAILHTASASTGRAALKWQPTDTLLVRASWSEGFRLPSLSELYLGQSDSFPTVRDPCSPPPNGKGTGKASLCPAGGTQPAAQIRTKVGGVSTLVPETATSKTAGFVYNPGWLPGFDFSADYYKISLKKAVSTLGAQNILDGCYEQGNPYDCNLVTRSGATVTLIVDTNINIGGIDTSGWDVSAHYKLPSTSVGDFKFGIDWTFLKDFDAVVPQPTAKDQFATTTVSTAGVETGAGGIPKQRANLSLSWNYGDWSAMWAVEYIHSMTEACPGGVDEAGYSLGSVPLSWCTTTGKSALDPKGKIIYPDATHHIGATFYHDVMGTYHVESWNTDFSIGIRNLFDKVPPIVFNAFANSFDPTYYRAPGRFFYGRVSVKF